MRHRIDLPTQYCTVCGQSLAEIVEADNYDCAPPSNVIAISHLVTARPRQPVTERL